MYRIWNSPAACFAFARAVAVKRWSFKSVSVFDEFGNESEFGREPTPQTTAQETRSQKRSVEYFAPLYYSHGTSTKRHLPNNPTLVSLMTDANAKKERKKSPRRAGVYEAFVAW